MITRMGSRRKILENPAIPRPQYYDALLDDAQAGFISRLRRRQHQHIPRTMLRGDNVRDEWSTW